MLVGLCLMPANVRVVKSRRSDCALVGSQIALDKIPR